MSTRVMRDSDASTTYPDIVDASFSSSFSTLNSSFNSSFESTLASSLSAYSSQTTVASSFSQPEPKPCPDLDMLHVYLERLSTLADQLRPIYFEMDGVEKRLGGELQTLWKGNSDIRKRGLRGGTARKQRKLGNRYVPIRMMTPDQNKRRREVERVDYLGRNRMSGLRILRGVFEDSFDVIRGEQSKCQEVLEHANEMVYGAATSMTSRIALAADELLGGQRLREIEDIEEMIDTFHEEFALYWDWT